MVWCADAVQAFRWYARPVLARSIGSCPSGGALVAQVECCVALTGLTARPKKARHGPYRATPLFAFALLLGTSCARTNARLRGSPRSSLRVSRLGASLRSHPPPRFARPPSMAALIYCHAMLSKHTAPCKNNPPRRWLRAAVGLAFRSSLANRSLWSGGLARPRALRPWPCLSFVISRFALFARRPSNGAAAAPVLRPRFARPNLQTLSPMRQKTYDEVASRRHHIRL